MTRDYSPPPPTPEQVQIYVAATALCLVEIGQLPPNSAAVQRAVAAGLDALQVPRIHPSQVLPIWQAAIEIWSQDPAICPLLLNP